MCNPSDGRIFIFDDFSENLKKKSFPEIFFLGPGDISLFGKTIKNKNASIGRVTHRTGYGNNAFKSKNLIRGWT